MRTAFRRLTPTRALIVALVFLLSLFLTPQAEAAAHIANFTYTCPPPPSCTGTGCNPWKCSIIQSGYYAYDAPAHLNAVKGNFTTGCFSGSSLPPNETFSSWIGIGGNNPAKTNPPGGPMVQTGVAWNGQNYFAFYEFPGHTNGPTYSTFSIPCNTAVQAQIYQNASGQFCTQVTWYPYNSFNNFPHCFLLGWVPDQTTAQWIDERHPCIQTAFPTIPWSNVYAYSPEKNWHTLAYWPRTAAFMIDMQTPKGDILEAPSNPIQSATTFNDVSTGVVAYDPSNSGCVTTPD